MDRSELRRLLQSVFRVDADLNEFCGDYFPGVYGEFTDGMNRTGKYNLLLDKVSGEELLAHLRSFMPNLFAAQNDAKTTTDTAPAGPGQHTFDASALDETVKKYGKLAILVDDASDAESRVARELYATEVLPEWWHLAASTKCAVDALSRLEHLLKTNHKLPCIVVMDRYLPDRCSDTNTHQWDSSEGGSQSNDTLRAKLHTLVTQLKPKLPFIKFVTSYERTLKSPDPKITWEARRLETIRSLREDIAQESAGLLRFGTESAGEAYKELGAKLKMGRRTILLTGWGVSESVGGYGAGLPPLERFKTECATSRKVGQEPQDQPVLKPPGPSRTCGCHRAGSVRSNKQSGSTLDKHIGSEFIFCSTSTPNELCYYQICNVVRHYDTGFAYHHWLMARLPWHALITTACDGFHERAAMAAARIPWLNDPTHHTRRLGTPANLPTVPNPRGSGGIKCDASFPGDGLLYKLFGRLFAPGTDLHTAIRERQAAKQRLDFALRTATPSTPLMLVSVGMCNQALAWTHEVLHKARPSSTGRFEGDRKIWVCPDGAEFPGWELWRATPLEFTFDLWRAYSQYQPPH